MTDKTNLGGPRQAGIVAGPANLEGKVCSGRLRQRPGDVLAHERIELAGKARVQGNLHYKVVEMSAGAQLTGRLVHADAVPAAGHEGAVQPEAWAAADA
mgnify:CR=1 FL=1